MFHERILTAVIDAGGVPYQVGGSIRDELLGLPVKDHDIEVFHLPADVLARVLAPFRDVSEVEADFSLSSESENPVPEPALAKYGGLSGVSTYMPLHSLAAEKA